jgi:hypothetical protein
MWVSRHTGAMILYGGWLLLSNPAPQRLDAPLTAWKKVEEYDTPYLCEQQRHARVAEALAKDAKAKPTARRMAPGEAELRWRCERAEHLAPPGTR